MGISKKSSSSQPLPVVVMACVRQLGAVSAASKAVVAAFWESGRGWESSTRPYQNNTKTNLRVVSNVTASSFSQPKSRNDSQGNDRRMRIAPAIGDGMNHVI